MTPVFTPDFGAVEAAIPVYPKGRYQLKVTKASGMIRDGKDKKGNDVVQQAVKYSFEMIGKFDEKGKLITKDFKGRAVSQYTIWTHSEGGLKYGKPFLIAAAGFKIKEEQKANVEFFKKHEWFIKGEKDADPEAIQLGSGYLAPIGKVLDVNLEPEMQKSKDGTKEYENQDFSGWTPGVIGGAAGGTAA